MVLDAINIVNELNKIASIKYLVLCADPQAKEFYEKIEFEKMNTELEEIPREHSNIPFFLNIKYQKNPLFFRLSENYRI